MLASLLVMRWYSTGLIVRVDSPTGLGFGCCSLLLMTLSHLAGAMLLSHEPDLPPFLLPGRKVNTLSSHMYSGKSNLLQGLIKPRPKVSTCFEILKPTINKCAQYPAQTEA